MSYSVRYVRREYEVARYYDVRCDGCRQELQPEAPVGPDGGWQWLGARGALRIRLISEFWGFFDSAQDRDPVVLLCHDCANGLLELFPGIREIIRNVDSLPEETGGPFGLSLRDPNREPLRRDPDYADEE
ncbi:MAG TPA: hypothetical protein VMU90_14605 [Solirubrobacteraceae bacterium]|nr:hypothetical protein [Solirubrobacteraceae bacterium]